MSDSKIADKATSKALELSFSDVFKEEYAVAEKEKEVKPQDASLGDEEEHRLKHVPKEQRAKFLRDIKRIPPIHINRPEGRPVPDWQKATLEEYNSWIAPETRLVKKWLAGVNEQAQRRLVEFADRPKTPPSPDAEDPWKGTR